MKTITFKILLMAITVTMMACGGSQNRNTNTDNTMGADSLNSTESMTDDQLGMGTGTNAQDNSQDFIQEAANSSLMEIELGKYAQQNAQNPRVKNFAAMMVRDHSQASETLKSLASGKNITVPTTMENNHRDQMSGIQKKTGAEFDKEYMKVMVDDHEKSVDKFKKFAEDENADPDLKSFATQTLSTLLVHQDSAKKIMDALQ